MSEIPPRRGASMGKPARFFLGVVLGWAGVVHAQGLPAGPESTQVRSDATIGTGIVLGPQGPILTNAHVVEACNQIEVRDTEGRGVMARVRRLDGVGDMALLDAPLAGGRSVRLRDAPVDTEAVAVSGYPGGTATVVVATGLAGEGGAHTSSDAFPVQAAVAPGNSGGAVLDQYGNMVGLVFGGANAYAGGYAIAGWRVRSFLAESGIGAAPPDTSLKMPLYSLQQEAVMMSRRIICWRGLPPTPIEAPEGVVVERTVASRQAIEPSATAPW